MTKFAQLRALIRCVAVSLAVGVPGIAAADPIAVCSGNVCAFTRHLDVFYGSWDVVQQGNPNPASTQTRVEFTDHVNAGLWTAIVLLGADPRVLAALPDWLDLTPTNVEWVIDSPESLPALANFNDFVAGLGGAITIDSGYLAAGSMVYLLDTFVEPTDGRTYNFYASVSYFERNGSVIVAASVVPEPGTLALLGLGISGLVVARRRRAA